MYTAVSEKTRMHGATTIETQLAGVEAAAGGASVTDARLVRLAAGGDELAFEAIVARYRAGLLRYAQRIVGPGRAEDAVQQALVNAWRALHRGCEVRALRPWLFTIVHRSSLELLRGEGAPCAPLAPTLAGGPSPEEQAELARRAETMLSAIAELPAAGARGGGGGGGGRGGGPRRAGGGAAAAGGGRGAARAGGGPRGPAPAGAGPAGGAPGAGGAGGGGGEGGEGGERRVGGGGRA